jgi:hypothetical protein
MRPLAVDLDALITVLAGPFDHLLERQRIAAIPNTQVGDAIQSHFQTGRLG